MDALNKLCKWRSILAGWHGGTRSINQPGTQAMRDLMDKWLIMRAENNAIAALLLEKGIVTSKDFSRRIEAEAFLMDKDMEKQFPGFRSSDAGIDIYDVNLANQTMKRLGFPP